MFQDRDFRQLFENAPIGLAVCNMDGQLVLVNQAFADILGRSIDETLELEYWHITPRQYEQQEQAQLAELNSKRRYGPYEKHYIHRDGSLVPVRLNGCKVSIEGNEFIWSAVERLEMPIHSVTLFKEAPIGLALCRMDGRLVAVNEAYARIMGRDIEQTLKLDYWQITPRKYQKQEEEQLKILKETGRYGPYAKDYIHADGHLVPVILVGKLLRINGEDFIWSVCQEGQEVLSWHESEPEEAGPISRLTEGLIVSDSDPQPIRPRLLNRS